MPAGEQGFLTRVASLLFVELWPFTLAIGLGSAIAIHRLRSKEPDSWRRSAMWSAVPLLIPVGVVALFVLVAIAAELGVTILGPIVFLLVLNGLTPVLASAFGAAILARQRRADPLLVGLLGLWAAVASIVVSVSVWSG